MSASPVSQKITSERLKEPKLETTQDCTIAKVAGYALMVLAAAFLVGSVIIGFTVGILPAVAGVVSALALGFLGDHLAKKDSYEESAIDRIFQRRVWHCKSQPTGLSNRHNTCWANAFFQAVLMLPQVQEEIIDDTPEGLQQICGMILQYKADQRNQRNVSSVDTEALRSYLPRDFDENAYEDATELTGLLGALSSLHVYWNEDRCYDLRDLPKPKPTELDISGDQTLGYSRFREHSFGQLILPIARGVPFDYILNSAFISLATRGERGIYDSDEGETSYPLSSISSFFDTPPPYLFLMFRRLQAVRSRSGIFEGLERIYTPLRIPAEFTLPRHAVARAEAPARYREPPSYRIVSIIEHVPGDHYVAYIRVIEDGQVYWFRTDDSSVVRVTEGQALAAASRAYMVVTERIDS